MADTYKKMKVDQLKEQLQMRGLSTQGKKDELVQRLVEAVQEENALLGTTGAEPVFVDDHGDWAGTGHDADHELEDSSQPQPATKRPPQTATTTFAGPPSSKPSSSAHSNSTALPSSIVTPAPSSTINGATKPPESASKVSLSTTPSAATKLPTVAATTPATNGTSAPSPVAIASPSSDQHASSIQATTASGATPAKPPSEMTETERKLWRAQRFGLEVPAKLLDEEKKRQRALRFGVGEPAPVAAVTVASKIGVDPETLKKRVEKFGAINPAIQKSLLSAEEEEKKRKRIEKFGIVEKFQIEAIGAMLNLNVKDTDSTVPALADPIWKVLVYDQMGQDAISPLLKVNQLREQGITVHMSLNSDRQSIPDVPAIYFVEPSSQNIKRISEDLSKHLYESYYLNFISAVSRPLLEELAAETITHGTSRLIAQVYDQYLNFVCLEANLFSLNMNQSYYSLNNPAESEHSISQTVDKVAGSLFSVAATLGSIPVIRAARGNAAEMVAQKLDSRLRDHLSNSRNNLFTDQGIGHASYSRPLFIILDRNTDLVPMLSHTWTYAPLVHDVLDMKLNRVTVTLEEKGGQRMKKVYDVDVTDFFWSRNAGTPFPQVAEDVDSEINKYKKDVDEVTKSAGVTSLDQIDPNDFSANAKVLKTAINQLPELTERKRTIDMHMNIATSLLNSIKERNLDYFFAEEESIAKQSKASILDAIKSKGSADDKMRFFLIWYLSTEGIGSEDVAELESALEAAGCDMMPLKYVHRMKAFGRMTAASVTPAVVSSSTPGDFLGKLTGMGSKLTDHLKEGTLISNFGGAYDTIISNVKNLLPTRKDLPITRITDTLMDSSGADLEDYLYFDPKIGRTRGEQIGKGNRARTVFQDAVVFVVGGGNYLEYQNLQEFAQRQTQKKRITYGSTELLTATQFLSQLAQLGQA
ncbi:Vesicle trafficking between the ER and Golgi [Gonapodya sp. JEL0774]|nr:Vesicle trafficking between the ER and Golgi [Gonapodya sp. JEL0774]